jgi:outer membrane protein OmpA-like peptidoglycan-associated protein
MFKKVLIGAVAVALSSGAAHAGENKFTKEEGTGMATGAATGAIVGGPIGAMVGLMIGGIVGDSIGTAKRSEKEAIVRADELQQELVDTRIALAKASERTGGDEMLDALAARLHADVMFRTGTAELDGDVQKKIADLGQLLASHPQLEIQLHGFADPRGQSEKNLELSMSRASAVRDALIDGGAAPDQIRISAHGEDLTTAPKDDLEAYAWERRVSISIRPTSPAAVAQSR